MKRLLLLLGIGLFVVTFVGDTSGDAVKKKSVRVDSARYLEYEGVLTDASGNKMTGEHTMVFRLYDSMASQRSIWEETHHVVVNDGEFRIRLGQRVQLPSPSQASYCIGISVDGEDLVPRQSFALNSDEVSTNRSTVTGATTITPPVAIPFGSDCGWTDDGTDVRLTTSSDYVGIGTTNPNTKLEVVGNTYTTYGLMRVNNTEGGTAIYADGDGSSSSQTNGIKSYATNTGSGDAVGVDIEVSDDGTGDHYGLDVQCSGASSSLTYGTYANARNTQAGGVYGGSFSTSSLGTGIHYGVTGAGYSSAPAAGIGVSGYATNSSSGNAFGGQFTVSNSGTGDHYGVQVTSGGASSGTTYGVKSWGYSSGDGDVYAGYFNASESGAGDHWGLYAWSENDSSGYSRAVHGYGENRGTGISYGGDFEAYSYGGGTAYGVYSYVSASGAGTHYGIYGYEASGGSGAAVYASGDQIASGTKSAVVRTSSSGHRLVYAMESPEIWFEDVGEGRLTQGSAHVDLEPLFLETVTIDDDHPMQVFLQLTSGEPMPSVVERGKTGFDVRVSDKMSSASFSYRVLAKRKGYEGERLRETDVGYDDPNLYPELLVRMERERDEKRAKREQEQVRVETESQTYNQGGTE